MKRITLVLGLAIFLTGCSFIRSQKVNFDTCMADVDCKASAQAWQDRVETASVVVASAVPVPGAAAAPKILGYVALFLSALIGGHALTKKKKEETPVV